MFLTESEVFISSPFENEDDLEKSIIKIQNKLFGNNRIYLNIKKIIGDKKRKQNIPDGYLIDLTNGKNPKLYVVEVELLIHDPLNHIAVQLLEFSLSFENSKQKVKDIIKNSLKENHEAMERCKSFIDKNAYENIDYLLERMIYKEKDAFNALVVIDEIDDFLERVLHEKFKFPIEVISVERLTNIESKIAYNFEPFLQEIELTTNINMPILTQNIDSEIIDTIVVPAQEDGFNDVFIGENKWYAIRIHSSMIDKIKYIAAYRVAPISAITHIAKVKEINQYQDSNKYVVEFIEPAEEIDKKYLKPKSIVKAPQGPRYTTYQKLMKAHNLDEVF